MIQKLLPKLMVAFLATALLASCASKPEDSGIVVTDAEMTTTPREDITMIEDYQQPPVVETTGPAPGTQQDLAVNVGDRVFFGYDQYDLSMEARNVLERQAAWLRQYPNIRITIEGHADERGTREYNLALGDRRAQSARKYLIALGVDAARITTISYGKERPAVVGSDPTAWAQNRRAVTVVE